MFEAFNLGVLFSVSDNHLVVKKARYSVCDTMDKFEAIVKEKGLGIVARVNHQKSAQANDLTLGEAQVLIFGNPKAGTLIMQKNIQAALDLPMRVAVYADENNDVYICYRKPASLAESYDLQGLAVLDAMNDALDKLTSAAAS